MRLEASQQLRMSQEMRLSPRIIQAMEILQLPVMALQERIEAELQSNPVLELHEGDGDGSDEAPRVEEAADEERGERDMVVREKGGHEEDFNRLDRYTEEYGADAAGEGGRGGGSYAGERDRKMDAMANTPAPEQNLTDYLIEQWAFVEATDEVKTAGSALIPYITDDGYLRTPLAEIAAASSPPFATGALEAALKLVQGLDPIGVGARDLKECLLLQLAAEEAAGADVTLERAIVQDHLADIEMNRLPVIARRTHKSVEAVKAAIENLARLNPRPGLLVGTSTAPVIRPDILVDVDEHGQVIITTPDGDTPRLYISGTYRKMIRDRIADTQTRQFVRNNVRAAQWLIDAIRQRQHTVHRVAEEVFAVQREFLESGPEALRPLPMADVARKVGVHVATVSRAVAGKYVQTPRGIYPLRMFFSGGKSRDDGGADVAWDAIKVKLKEVIDAEDKRNPLGDDELALAIRKGGIDIARRTVAKYRSALNIPPRLRRRQF
jgi:RNA polymerase sigma-54 factor